jgi:PAS domain S-box-containing protein
LGPRTYLDRENPYAGGILGDLAEGLPLQEAVPILDLGTLANPEQQFPGDAESLGRPPAAARKGDEAGRLQLAAIIDSSDDAIISKTLEGIITSWNPGAERMFGYAAHEAVGKPMLMLFPPDRVNEEQEILTRIRHGERMEHFETARVRKDGGRIDVSVTISPIKDSHGRIVGASKIARDITEQKRSEQRLLDTVREMKDIRAALDEHSIVAITDGQGRITYVNDKFCSISKYTREELLGKDHRIINSRHHPKEFFKVLWTTIGGGGVWHGEIKNRAKDGSFYWVATTIFPRLNPAGVPVQYISIRTDITQRKADEAELQRFAADLAEKNKELETIVYTVSHDLRSPLVNVQGFGKQLNRACDKIIAAVAAGRDGQVSASELKAPVEVAIPQALRFINAGVNKMEMLLNGLLRFSRLGRIAFTIQPLDMNEMISEILAAMRFQIDDTHAEVHVAPLPGCRGDRVQTSQAFANLLDNAIKYRDPFRPLRIRVAGSFKDGMAVYTVADNGIGIAPGHQGKAFEIFHRLNPDSGSGEGLGLTIAQRVLEREGGKIWIESQEGVGSTFYVALPAGGPPV